MTGRWGDEGPPEEAHSRATNPERFEPLIEAALTLLEQLDARYDVERAVDYGLDPELERSELALPTRRLSPRDERAAPIVMVFTTFPGVRTRFGRWHVDAFPRCGCDACDETAEAERERLASTVDDVVSGRFRESLDVPVVGSAWYETGLWSPDGNSSSGKQLIDEARVPEMLAGDDLTSYDWGPWPRR
jgi:hypothetical protein